MLTRKKWWKYIYSYIYYTIYKSSIYIELRVLFHTRDENLNLAFLWKIFFSFVILAICLLLAQSFVSLLLLFLMSSCYSFYFCCEQFLFATMIAVNCNWERHLFHTPFFFVGFSRLLSLSATFIYYSFFTLRTFAHLKKTETGAHTHAVKDARTHTHRLVQEKRSEEKPTRISSFLVDVKYRYFLLACFLSFLMPSLQLFFRRISEAFHSRNSFLANSDFAFRRFDFLFFFWRAPREFVLVSLFFVKKMWISYLEYIYYIYSRHFYYFV